MNDSFLYILAACAVSALPAKAAFTIDVSGGLNTPLSIEILEGDTFLTTAPSSSTSVALVFENFWDTFTTSVTSSFDTDTIAMTGATSSSQTGALAFGGIGTTDLTVAFIVPSPGLLAGQNIEISSGTRTTSNNLNLLYTALNSSGNARLHSGLTGFAISGPIEYTIVPEPTSITLASMSALSLLLVRRRGLR